MYCTVSIAHTLAEPLSDGFWQKVQIVKLSARDFSVASQCDCSVKTKTMLDLHKAILTFLRHRQWETSRLSVCLFYFFLVFVCLFVLFAAFVCLFVLIVMHGQWESEIGGRIGWLSNLWFQRRSLTLSISLQPLFPPRVSSPQRGSNFIMYRLKCCNNLRLRHNNWKHERPYITTKSNNI